jgi:hypothetical protein
MDSPDYGTRRMADLATRLLTLTTSNKITWSEGEGGSYIYDTANSSISIRNADNDGKHPYVLDVYSARGEVVDTLRSRYVVPGSHATPLPWNDVLESLFTMARRSALNVDAVLDELLASLPDDD